MSTKRVIKNSIIYTITSIIQNAITFLLLPLFTAYLTPEAYGIVGMTTIFISFSSIFILLSLHGAATYYTYEIMDDKEKIKILWGTIFTFVVTNALVIFLIILLFHQYSIDLFMKGITFYPYLLIGTSTAVLSSIYMLYQCYLQTMQDGRKYGLNSISFFLVNLILTLIFVVVLRMAALGILLAVLVTNLIFAAYTFIVFVPKIKLGVDKTVISKTLIYSLPLLPHSLSGWIMTMVDRIFLNSMKTTAAVGIYSVGFQFGSIMGLIAGAVNQAYVPWFFQMLKKGTEGEEKIIKFSEITVVFYSWIALNISLFSKDILNILVSGSFKQGWVVVPIITFSNVFSGFYYLFVNVLFEKNTKLVTVVTFCGAVINITLNVILIPRYNYIGSAIANFIGLFFTSIIAYLISRKVRKINFPVFKMYSICIVFFLIALLSYYDISTIIRVSLSGLMVLFVLIAYKTDICSKFKSIVMK